MVRCATRTRSGSRNRPWTPGRRLAASAALLWLSAFLCVASSRAVVGATSTAAPHGECGDRTCENGRCVHGECECDPGWQGERCEHCGGRFLLEEPAGIITDGPSSYKHKMKCSWLVKGPKNVPLRLRFNHFATECSWDHLYVFDGDSVYSPLLAAFSGLIVPEKWSDETVPEVVAHSGSAFLHFFSDAAYNLTGFNISYSFSSCPNNCSGHGRCNTSGGAHCLCEDSWKGEACNQPYCRDNCGSPFRGFCDIPGKKCCMCNSSWQGPDCSVTVPANESYWMLLDDEYSSFARTSHEAVVHNGSMWIVGGHAFSYSGFPIVLSYDLRSSSWTRLKPIHIPFYPRYGHSAAIYEDSIFMYGGRTEQLAGNVTDELWVFDIPKRTWSIRVPKTSKLHRKYAAVGHTAHIVEISRRDPVMLVFFGHNPVFGYLSNIQEYNLNTNEWQILETHGALVRGGYGHSSVYDPVKHSVFVHGGCKYFVVNHSSFTDDLYRFDVLKASWTVLKSSGFPRYLHSAVIIGGAMLVFGGNTHNDTSVSMGAKCFSADFMAYDIECDVWYNLPSPELHLYKDRFGHSAVAVNGSMYVFGGFNSLILHDLLVYTPKTCGGLTDSQSCRRAEKGLHCVWNASRCLPLDSALKGNSDVCNSSQVSGDKGCRRYPDCSSCLSSDTGCTWCGDACLQNVENCTESVVENADKCVLRGEDVCAKMTSCMSCVNNLSCQWDSKKHQCTLVPDHTCGDGWDRVGDSCFRINVSEVNYDDARMDCIRHGGMPASLITPQEMQHVLSSLWALESNNLMPWVGLRSRNISFWSWEDSSPFVNSSALQWEPHEPSGSGFCAVLSRPSEGPWLKALTCTDKAHGSVCKKLIVNPSQTSRNCQLPCASRTSCSECATSGDCMWCSNTRRCVDANAYVISFPYGQCMEWHMQGKCPPESCAGHRTCEQSFQQPACGWCNDPSKTGKGQGMEGSADGPVSINGSQAQLNMSLCPRDQGFTWHFIQCPPCQCNGHSSCVNNSACENCQDLTRGPNCEMCMAGFFGDSVNGGSCQACKCNNHATECNPQTGTCYCTTKGIKGNHCQECDVDNKYTGDPKKGTCYYPLMVDYQYTFTLTQEDDEHYTSINFKTMPEELSRDLEVSIDTSKSVDMNITWSPGSLYGAVTGEEMLIVTKTNIRSYKESFSSEKYDFRGNPNITFYVYISNFTWKVKVQIAFAQHSSFMDLVQFFITFFSCFLSLLLVAAVVWKIKQSCWATRRREISGKVLNGFG
uniref:attractin-like protein 1 isoform X2 n=1 Tax=Myxine glutinosa TaxID=7769 RepID=UPI00358EE444